MGMAWPQGPRLGSVGAGARWRAPHWCWGGLHAAGGERKG